MAILVKPSSRVEQWADALATQMPHEDLRVWPNVGDPTEIDYLIAWEMTVEEMEPLVNLQALLSLGAGTEQWQRPGIDVPVVRLVDTEMSNEMAGYVLAWVLRHQRRFAENETAQRARRWEVLDLVEPCDYHVGVLGYGAIGSRIGQAFVELGYSVNAWTRSGRDDASVNHFVGFDGLEPFLGSSDAVVNVLPSTTETVGLLDAVRFSQFRQGAVFVNIGRGNVVASGALLDALDNGPLAAAVLDVTAPEPPPLDSPLWTHPAVTLTPHISGRTQVRSAARLIAANVARLRAGEPPFPLLDRSRGY